MTKEHVKLFAAQGWTLEKIENISEHLIKTGQEYCFVDGQIIDRGFCERYIKVECDIMKAESIAWAEKRNQEIREFSAGYNQKGGA